MTIRQLLALTACWLIFLSPARADNQHLAWSYRKIQRDARSEQAESAIPSAIAVRSGTDEIAIVGDDHLVRIRDRSTGKLVRVFETHSDWLKTAVYSPDGKTLFTAGADHTIIAWNAENENDFQRFTVEGRSIESMAIDPTGALLANVGFDNQLSVYDVSNRKLLYQSDCPCSDMRTVAFSPKGDRIAVGGRCGMIRILNAENGSKVCDLAAHHKRIRKLVFLTADQVVSCSDDQTVRLTDVVSRQSVVMMKKRAKFFSLAHLGGSRVAVGASDNMIRILDTQQRTEVGSLQGHRGTVCELVADGKELISGSFDTQIRIWEFGESFVQDSRRGPAVQAGIRTAAAKKETGGGAFQPRTSGSKPAVGPADPVEKGSGFQPQGTGFSISK